MSELLTYNEEFLKSQNGYWTAKEICQQPRIWREAAANVDSKRSELDAWLTPILAQANLRIILTGAGTSAYVGEAIAPHLSQQSGRLFEAVSTTDIVSNAPQYLLKTIPTLLISYGRSGNSPESVAAVKLAEQVVDNCYHLVITCNPEGDLATNAEQQDNAFSLLMPEGTLDQSFAMTSSFTSMLVSTVAIFAPQTEQLEIAAQWAENFLDKNVDALKEQAKQPTQRLVFLGAGNLQGIAREAALKVLELTAGQVLSYFESPLGFRHGPKSLMDASTEVVFFSSSDSYTKLYDQDLLAELHRDDQALAITTLTKASFNHAEDIADVWAGLPYILYCQILAFFKSMQANITPDNPCPTGEVNRVVQGVTLYPLEMH
ncbi:SIS domain-containing protein [Thalassotalea fonticola]|uniref:SIS domain-containing protein n=1 Tax=Thalassotalea fonticola TaxID=3065649 RepID=A0ABZ0GL47_9GAMM|nr:SIS domain-containing protein [Colwelliaceae bacterium S1-1]